MEEEEEKPQSCPMREINSTSPRFNAEAMKDVYMKIMEASPDALVAVDDGGVILAFNSSAELMFGYARCEVEGELVEVLIPDNLKALHVKLREGYMLDPRSRQMGISGELKPLKARHRKGREFDVRITLSPILVVDAGVVIILVIRHREERR